MQTTDNQSRRGRPKNSQRTLASLQTPVLSRFFQKMNSFMNKNCFLFKPAKVWKKRDCFYIIFYWRPSPLQEFRRYKRTFDLNRIPDVQTRAIAAAVMAETVTQALREGWNPETDKFPEGPQGFTSSVLCDLVEDAHRSILAKTDKRRTIQSYESHKRAFVAYLKKAGCYQIEAREFNRIEAQRYQEYLITQGFEGKTINTKTDYASGLFRRMHRLGLIAENPFSFLEPMKEKSTASQDKLYTREELRAICDHLNKVCPELWQAALFIYYCLMRPSSVVSIAAEDIRISERTLKVYGENHKNGQDAIKQLLSPHIAYLEPYLKKIQLQPGQLLFSTQLKPGVKKIAPTRLAEAWNTHVQQELGINKKMYWLKDTGAAHFLENNPGQENLKWLQMQMSHADLQTTSIYTNKLKVIWLDENKTKIESI